MLGKLRKEKEDLAVNLEKYRECDPEVLQKIKEQTVEAKEAANRWTGDLITHSVITLH